MEHWSVPGLSMPMLCKYFQVKKVFGSELLTLKKAMEQGEL